MDKNFWKQLQPPILALAPMVGITDSAFRQLARQWGAQVLYSEMISADALVHGSVKTLSMLDHTDTEYPFVVQLMGKEPAVLAQAARIAEKHGASGIDINFGCPAHKIARNFCGVMLMRDLERSRALIKAVCDAVSIPVSIKVRLSIKKDKAHEHATPQNSITILDFLEKISDLPIAAIMVHGRSFEDPFEGGIRMDMIAEVKKRFIRGPVLANGGVTTIESAKEVLATTGADGIGFARSVIGKPWVFRQVSEYLTTGAYEEIPWPVMKETLLAHVRLFEQYRGAVPFRDIRRHLTHYIKGRPGASELRQQLTQVNSVADVVAILAQS